MNTFDALTINIYKMPESGDQVLFADGSRWLLKQRDGRNWGLYDAENGHLHSAIGLHASMVELCASTNAQADFVQRTVLVERSIR